MPYDAQTYRQGMSGPENDTRQWISLGTVVPDTPEARSVEFDKDLGPLVNVQLIPDGTVVVCRVGMSIAGDLEGDYSPFVGGDEVLVAIPEGSEALGGVILARLANAIDRWPQAVAGQDATKNVFGFKRMRPPYIIETQNGILFRHAGTGAQLGIDLSGQVIFNDASGARMFFGADAQGMTSADGDTSFQLLSDKQSIVMTAGGVTSLNIGASTTQFLTPGTIAIGSSGLGATGHAVTLEQVVNLLVNYTCALYAAGGLGQIFSVVALGAPPNTANLTAILTAVLNGAILNAPPGPLPGGDLTSTGLQQVINSVLATQGPDVQGLIIPLPQFKPGVGRPGFML